MAKLFASEAGVENSLEAMRIFGGYSYSDDFDVERFYRDAPLMCIGEGTNEMQRMIIARSSSNGTASDHERPASAAARPAHPDVRGFTAPGRSARCTWPTSGPRSSRSRTANRAAMRRAAWGPFFLGENDSHFFQTFNLNKRSVTLNLKTAIGQPGSVPRLVATSDAVLNNLRGDQPDKLGPDLRRAEGRNPSHRLRAPVGLRPRQRARAPGPATTT
jgi:hypothetical protein